MAETQVVNPITTKFPTATNLTDKEGYAAEVDGTLATDGTTIACPIVIGANGSGTATDVTVAIGGTAYFKTGGIVAAGAKMTATTGGAWIATTTDTENYGGIAIEGGASGDMIRGIVTQGMIAG